MVEAQAEGEAAVIEDILQHAPSSFLKFLSENDINKDVYKVVDLPRFVRVNTALNEAEWPTELDLQEQLETDVWPIPDFFGFYAFKPHGRRLMDCEAYKTNKIFGMDISSALAVAALDIQPDDHILDLCCAPGAKLCMMSNLLGREGAGTITGVDVSAHRIATCRKLLKRYQVGDRCRLFHGDGTKFHVHAPIQSARHIKAIGARTNGQAEPNDATFPQSTAGSVKPYWAPRLLRFDPQVSGSEALYDKVVVDAECTHDGSIQHIIKYSKNGWKDFENNFMDANRLDNLTSLQRNLMANGWKMLKRGAIMVYSTCSLSIAQNEENVYWFLQHHPDASLHVVPTLAGFTSGHIKTVPNMMEDDQVMNEIKSKCVRFDPIASRTSGLFIARFLKA
ncbi:hypothetical protein BZG36_01834 [Bifiguratus adelaidae]|uniref:SAM-dependent MTase RsmB/NOP-type domain-containing protein n=1 Tax=Bifiguratus adelaidae TaxID=1938954 RepID=A0A261Y2M7_9FUNG|nr:hypothetical protein BZG36_01834 [Bifiguratus adelaidae]